MKTFLWPGNKGASYDVRTPLWGQRWVWDRAWIRGAMRHNTVPALIVRGAATAAFQALLILLSCAYGLALGLYVIGVI